MILSTSNVFFVDLMGVDRTTVGRTVVCRLNLLLFDSDYEIEARCDVHIPVIFEHEGEVGFHDRETHMIDELTARDGVVITTGEGAMSRAENRTFLREHDMVIYLYTNPHDLYLRTRHDENRPLLQTEDPRVKLEELHTIRDPLYHDVAHFVIKTGKPTVAQLVNMVLVQLEVAGIMTPPAGSSTPSQVSPQS